MAQAIDSAYTSLVVLPDDVMLLIFSRLSPASVTLLGSTCKRFQRLSSDSQLWMTFCNLTCLSPMEKKTTGDHVIFSDNMQNKKRETNTTSFQRVYNTHVSSAWRWRTGQIHHEQQFRGHTGPVIGLDVQGGVFVSGSVDKTVRVWDTTRNLCVGAMQAPGPVFAVRFGVCEDSLVTGGADNNISIWSVSEMARIHVLRGHRGPVYDIDVDRKQRVMLTASEDGLVALWRVEPIRETISLSGWFTGHTDAVHCVRAADGMPFAVSGSSDSTLHMFDLTSMQSLHRIPIRPLSHAQSHTPCHPNTIHISGNCLMAGCEDGSARVWDMRSGTHIHSFPAHSAAVMCLQFDGTKAVTGGEDGVRVWDVRRWLSATHPDVTQNSYGVYGLADTHTVRSLCVSGMSLFTSVQNDVILFDYAESTRNTHPYNRKPSRPRRASQKSSTTTQQATNDDKASKQKPRQRGHNLPAPSAKLKSGR
eukprot:c1601_g1_i1.p1 GENE.c1601_g1_i1~~c1601_g1_i1.p1  ORF type:complete len:507 (+),score=133.30 c1601_g1_i1:98-1522(+)